MVARLVTFLIVLLNVYVAYYYLRQEKRLCFTYVCLSVCLSAIDYSKSYERILMKFLEGRGVAQGTIS